MTTTMTASNLFEYKQMVYHTDLKSRALSVLMYLVDRADNKAFTCYPSIKTIGEQLHISISTVKRAMKELLERGFLKREARFALSKNGGQTSNLYTLTLPQEQPLNELFEELDHDDVIDCTSEEVSCVELEEATEHNKKCEVKHISFDMMKSEKKQLKDQGAPPVQKKEVPPVHLLKHSDKSTSNSFLRKLFRLMKVGKTPVDDKEKVAVSSSSVDGTGVHFDTPFNLSD